MKYVALASLALTVVASHPAGAQPSAREVLAKTDSVRNPGQPFRVTNTVIDYIGGKARDQLTLTVYAKRDTTGRFLNLVRYAAPARDEGKMVLLNGGNMWFYDPTPKTSVRISPQQRLIGLASNGDVVTVSLARDYTATIVGVDTLQDADRVRRVCWHLDLAAADDEAVYHRIELWVEQGTYHQIKGKYYSDSGRPLKVAYYHKYEEQLGAVRPDEAVIIDAVDPNQVTTLTLSDYHFQDVPDAWFQRDFLPRLSFDQPKSEDTDLAAIPGAVRDTATPRAPVRTTSATRGRIHVEDAGTATDNRTAWALDNRTSLDVVERFALPARVNLNASGRLNLVERDGAAAGYDFREGYVTWEPVTRTYLEVGRVNLHNGVALGFNPTDFFKTRTLLDQASEDPSVIRDDRLGTLMGRAEAIWNGGAASVVFAPKLYNPSAIATVTKPTTSLALDRTNAADRALATVGLDIADLAPHVFVYREGSETQFGADLSRLVGQSVVLYAEWAGGDARSLTEQAVRYGKLTGTIPTRARDPAIGDSAEKFHDDLAAGASWSSGPTTKLTINAEFHYHDIGYSHAEWREWFRLERVSAIAGYIRAFANDQQEPVAQQQAFVRIDRTDAIIRNLELTAFAFVNLSDASSVIQLAATYLASDDWTVSAYLPANIGAVHSERGSVPQAGQIIFALARYF